MFLNLLITYLKGQGHEIFRRADLRPTCQPQPGGADTPEGVVGIKVPEPSAAPLQGAR